MLILALALGGCGSGRPDGSALPPAPPDVLPDEVRQARPVVEEAYRIAFANRELLARVPCYCGCAASGHKSNYDCYVKSVDEAGRPVVNLHAVACNVCVDITRDTFRMAGQGATAAEIRAHLAENYSQYGASTGFETEVP
jgi:hypothetical protein